MERLLCSTRHSREQARHRSLLFLAYTIVVQGNTRSTGNTSKYNQSSSLPLIGLSSRRCFLVSSLDLPACVCFLLRCNYPWQTTASCTLSDATSTEHNHRSDLLTTGTSKQISPFERPNGRVVELEDIQLPRRLGAKKRRGL